MSPQSEMGDPAVTWRSNMCTLKLPSKEKGIIDLIRTIWRLNLRKKKGGEDYIFNLTFIFWKIFWDGVSLCDPSWIQILSPPVSTSWLLRTGMHYHTHPFPNRKDYSTKKSWRVNSKSEKLENRSRPGEMDQWLTDPHWKGMSSDPT